MKDPKDTPVVRAWFSKGDNDLKTAEIVLKESDAPPIPFAFTVNRQPRNILKDI